MATSDTTTDPPAHHEVSIAEDESVTFTDPAIRSNQAHDLEYWKAELVRVVDAARQDSNDAESISFLDGVLSQPAFLQRLTALEILSHRPVSPSWAAWFRENTATIASARRQDDSRDWYFPVFDPVIQYPTPSPDLQLRTRPLSGIWHATANHSSEGLFHALPPLAFPPRPPFDCCQARYHVIASSGGLLLVQTLPILRIYRPRRPGCESCGWVKWRWLSLMVINPLTRKLRVLPACEVSGIRLWSIDYLPAQGQIMVDDKANVYKVLLYSCEWTCYYVYDSRSGSWQNEPRIPLPVTEPELGRGVRVQYGGLKYYASACSMRRRLYFADIRSATATDWEINRNIGGVLRLLEMDIDTGDWKPRKDFLLRKFRLRGVEIRDVAGSVEFRRRCLLRNLELVECMGHMFAVIPARIDEFPRPMDSRLRIGRWKFSMPELKHMPLQFYVLQLDGEDVNGVVRIEIPTSCEHKSRRQSLFEKSLATNLEYMTLRHLGNWFSCTAKGSVIWVSCEDYLVQYDVVSGQSKTQIIPNIKHEGVGFAYRASFHMKP